MTNRVYRLLLGALLLLALTLDNDYLMNGLIIMLLFEGLTNWRLPTLINRVVPGWRDRDRNCLHSSIPSRFGLESERMWRIMVGTLLLISYTFLFNVAWFFPWFMGFAILGAGASGICPMEYTLRRVGFR